jgi:hypothetical protein
MSQLANSMPVLAVRFLLELAALVAFGYWGWHSSEGPLRFVLAIGLPLLLAVVWGVFGVTGDSRGDGTAPVPVAGWVRLVIEFGILYGAGVALIVARQPVLGAVYLLVLLAQNIIGYERVVWLLGH